MPKIRSILNPRFPTRAWVSKILCLTILLAFWGIGPGFAQSVIPLVTAANPDQGKQIALVCQACHSLKPNEPHKVGPNLWNILNASQASRSGFAYSPAFQKLTGVWDFDTLDQFLTNPANYVEGTKMVFPGIADSTDRAHLLAYLNQLSDNPVVFSKSEKVMPLPASQSGATTAFGDDWPSGPGSTMTGYACSACHSLAIVKQQGLTRADWDELLDWMVDEQGMDVLPTDQRTQVLNYLSQHFNVP